MCGNDLTLLLTKARWRPREEPGASSLGDPREALVREPALSLGISRCPASYLWRLGRRGRNSDRGPDDTYAAARSEFEERELVDLTIAISLMNADNRMAISFARYAASAAITLLRAAW